MQPVGGILTARARHEEGQVSIFVVLALAIFLLGFVGFAVDMTNLWFHRQTAQGAADAACQAGIMNVLVPTATQGFIPGTNFDCDSTPLASPCRYAALNGYNGTGLVTGTESNQVYVTFPGAVPGYPAPPDNLAPYPFLRVDVVDRVRLTFSALITRQPTADVRAFAECGLQLAKAPIPIIVLNPTCTHPFEVSGSASLKIVGGPSKSVQVNSFNQTCAAASAPSQCTGNATIDLSEGGPNFTGSRFGVYGAPYSAPPNFMPGATGSWGPSSPISDPFALTPPPNPPGAAPTPAWVGYRAFGCPDQSAPGGAARCGGVAPDAASRCCHYQPGLYTQPIVVKQHTAIFDPGVYYIAPASSDMDSDNCGTPGNGCVTRPTGQCYYDFAVDSNGVVRPSNVTGNGDGTMFYLSGSGTGARPYGSVFFGANAGKAGARIIEDYDTSRVTCLGGTPPDPRVGIPPTVPGNVLVGQCTTGGNYLPYDQPGPVRGLLFFGDRNNGTNGTYVNGQPSMQGGGGLLLSGSLYFTNWPNWGAQPPSFPPAGYNAFLQLQGTPGSGTFVLGNITADELVESGNGAVAMQLNPNSVYYILKATLLR